MLIAYDRPRVTAQEGHGQDRTAKTDATARNTQNAAGGGGGAGGGGRGENGFGVGQTRVQVPPLTLNQAGSPPTCLHL